MKNCWIILLPPLILVNYIYCAKILGVFHLPLVSHQRPYLNLGKHLSLKGHDVTIIVTNPLKDKSLTNLTEIDISELYELPRRKPFAKVLSSQHSLMTSVFGIRALFYEMGELFFSNKGVANLIKSDKQFDVVLVEPHDHYTFAFGERFKAPIIGKSLHFNYFTLISVFKFISGVEFCSFRFSIQKSSRSCVIDRKFPCQHYHICDDLFRNMSCCKITL